MVPVAMLLLDHNLPHQLRDLLEAYGLKAETAASRGWERLRNGELVTTLLYRQLETSRGQHVDAAHDAARGFGYQQQAGRFGPPDRWSAWTCVSMEFRSTR